MGTKDRQLHVAGCNGSTDWAAIKAYFEQYGAVQNCFAMPNNPSSGMVTFVVEQHADEAYRANGHSVVIGGQRLRVSKGGGKKGGNSSNSGWNNGHGNSNGNRNGSSNGHSNGASSSTTYMAPAPRILSSSADAVPQSTPSYMSNTFPTASTSTLPSTSATTSTSTAPTRPKDTWEASLEDSDYDDDFHPIINIKSSSKKAPPLTSEEWREAYQLVTEFTRYGGAILAVDCEAWDQQQDYIIEIGLTHVQWRAGNAIPPTVRAEHLIVNDHLDKRNGIYCPDAKDLFAFGKSKYLSEDEVNVYLRFRMDMLSKNPDKSDIKQPFILLFHDAKSERQYFSLMNIDLDEYAPRIPERLLKPIMNEHGQLVYKKYDRGEKIILDTQRLWRSYLLAIEEDLEKQRAREGRKSDKPNNPKKAPPLKLGNICRTIGIDTRFLHNAGNDSLYTLKLLMELCKNYKKHLEDVEPDLGLDRLGGASIWYGRSANAGDVDMSRNAVDSGNQNGWI